ncbi:hypothetical protein [Caldimonas sp. KR1-144]|uniref:hypothetical protein n=1 Tax=Caldimonas sp. KR1-144 TaxID=3400911 RepID=UPI003C0FBDD3
MPWRQRLNHWLRRKPLATLALMTVCLLGLGALSVNLYHQLNANLALIREHGVMALDDGAAQQLIELIAQALAATLFYAGVKVCEKLIVEWWTGR